MESLTKRVHFPYQHPRFGRANQPASMAGIRKSVYYWWWEYLRRSTTYRKALKGELKSKQLERLVSDFGDIHNVDFKEWWATEQRGARLFSTLDQKQVSVRPLSVDERGIEHLEISIPLNLPRRHIESRLKLLLDKHHKGRKGRQNARLQEANYSVSRSPNVNALSTALSVYDIREKHSDLPMWKVAVLAMPKYKPYRDKLKDPGFRLDYDLRRQAAVEVHRYIKQVKASINNTERGVFP